MSRKEEMAHLVGQSEEGWEMGLERTKQAEFWPGENGQMTKAQAGEKHDQTCPFK